MNCMQQTVHWKIGATARPLKNRQIEHERAVTVRSLLQPEISALADHLATEHPHLTSKTGRWGTVNFKNFFKLYDTDIKTKTRML